MILQGLWIIVLSKKVAKESSVSIVLRIDNDVVSSLYLFTAIALKVMLYT